MEIVFSINNNAEIMVMPAAPEFEIAEAQGNDTFQGLTVNIRMIGNKDNFTYKYRKNGDVDYTLDMTEYVFVRVGGING